MGAKSCGFFLSEATRVEPSAQWPLRLSGVPGVPVSDSSIPCSVAAARHGLGDSPHGSVFRSVWRSAVRSINRLNTRLPSGLSTDTLPTALSVPGSSVVDAPGVGLGRSPTRPCFLYASRHRTMELLDAASNRAMADTDFLWRSSRMACRRRCSN